MRPEQTKALYMQRRRAGRCVNCGELGLPPGKSRHDGCTVFIDKRHLFRRAPVAPVAPPSRTPAVTKKKCNRCLELKPADLKHFYMSRKARDGLQGACKNCERTRFERGPVYLRYGRHCTVCFGLSHQRDRCGCSGCGKPYAPEELPPIEHYAAQRSWRGNFPGVDE